MRPLICLLLLGSLLHVHAAQAQEIHLGADVVSRYVWRGLDFGESMSVQPGLRLTTGPLTIGTWASYAIATPGAYANEHDLYLSLNFGALTIGVTDYHFPTPEGRKFFNFDNNGRGAHYLEPFVQLSGPAQAPFTLFAGLFAYNDPDYSVYLEAQYPFAVNGVQLTAKVAAVGGRSSFYNTGSAALVTLGLSASRTIPITEQFGLPVFVSYILNPNPRVERSYLVFGLTL
ncbi:hypothetical protein [Rhodothermus bifroesti]|uniref:MetA-pathway of phenol degradation n=1 Tax=Rhodothermus marinus TaxID=29549 RepID=A0A7V2AZZ4_RHOMR|nr:hypothetical protein [Rhodothermus bifroesti]GBD02589.1 hypothetical protein HRbin18_02336 [bacterium HR18]